MSHAPYRSPAPAHPRERAPSVLPSILVLVGLLACFFAAGMGALHLFYRHGARKPVVDVSPAELADRRTDLHDPLRVTLTPQPARAVPIRAGSDAALLVPVEESPKLALVVRTETTLPSGSIAPSPAREAPPAERAVFVVHRAEGILIGDVWGVPRSELSLVALEDPREQAARDAFFTAVFAGGSFALGVFTAALGALLAWVRRRPHAPAMTA